MANVYRADHMGSLIPAEPLAAGAGPNGAQAVNALLSMQKQCGIDIFSDGELQRASPGCLFAGKVAGIQSQADGSGKRSVASGPLERKARLTSGEVEILKAAGAGPFKVALPAPTVAALDLFREGVTDAHYPTRRDLAQALAAILREEIADLIADGVPYIQLNGPAYESASDRAGAARLGGMEEMLRLDAAAVRDLPRAGKSTLALHMPHVREASDALLRRPELPRRRAAMLESALGRMPVDRFLIELPVSPAEADFAPLRAVPQGRMAVLGLVDPLAPRADDVDPLLRLLDLAATFVGTERLALSPRRGFAVPGAAHDARAFEAQRRALTLTAEAARRFWGFEM